MLKLSGWSFPIRGLMRDDSNFRAPSPGKLRDSGRNLDLLWNSRSHSGDLQPRTLTNTSRRNTST
jgi:hypothetical protein